MSWSFYWSSQPLNWCQASFVASCSQPDSCVAVCDCLSARRWRVRKERIKSQTLDAAADTTHPSDQFVAGCISASIHPRNPVWMTLWITSQSRPTCLMFMFLPHPFNTSLDTSIPPEPHLQTPRRRAQCHAVLLQPLGFLRRWDANGAPQRVRVARQGLGGGVHHSIHAQQQRPLQGWRCKPGQQIENGNSCWWLLMLIVGSRLWDVGWWSMR